MKIPPSISSNSELRALTEDDYLDLDRRWITRELADAALLRRVNSIYAAEMVGQRGRGGDYSGIAIPYVWPGSLDVNLYRLRRQHPDLEQGADGSLKPRRKYLSPPGGANRLYLHPQTELSQLDDVNLPVVMVEGEFKTLALWRLSWHGLGDVAETPAFLPVGLQGVWSWRGVVAKAVDAGGSRVDVKGPVPDFSRIAWTERRVVILFDADVEKNYRVRYAREGLTEELEGRGASVAWFLWPPSVPESQKGIDDFLAAHGPDAVIRLLGRAKTVTRRRRPATVSEAARGEDDWRSALLRSDKGIKPILANAMTALRSAPVWSDVLRFNEFAQRTEVSGGTPWRPEDYLWGDMDDIRLAEWMQHQGIEVTMSIANQAAEAVARERGYHPPREYLDGLVWDRKPRIDRWLVKYFGAPDTPLIHAVGAKWLISAVARVMQPGCQADYTLIMQGEQRIGKSSALRILAVHDEWFTDDMSNLGSKEAAMQLLGIWIVELGELTQIVGRAAEMEMVKSFLTRRVDHFRPPYGRRTADFARQCVFSGSTNAEMYFRDETGNTRFWPVICTVINTDGLKEERDQIWAEARARYDLKEKHWIEDPELLAAAEEEQDLHFQRDPWEREVWDYVIGARAAFVEGGRPSEAFTIGMEEILQKACRKEIKDWTRQDSTRVIAIMRHRGFEYRRERLYDEETREPLKDPKGRTRREYHFRFPDSNIQPPS